MGDDAPARIAPSQSVAESPPSRREWLGVAGLFLFALGLRLLNLQQIRAHDPFFALPSVDPRMYHEWAVRIAGGEWLGDAVFFLAPLYAYFLALVYVLFGPSFLAAKLVQCAIGSLTCVLVWRLAREVFDRRVAMLAGAMAAVYSMLIFYEGTLLVLNLQIPLLLLVLLATLRALEFPTAGRWLLVGALVGLAALARANALLFAPAMLVWLLWSLRGRVSLARRLALAAALTAGTGLLVLPATARNYAVGGDLTLITSSGGSNFFVGNNPDANGAYRIPLRFQRTLVDDQRGHAAAYHAYAERSLGRELLPSEGSAFWVREGLAFIRERPGDWLRLEVRKLILFLNAVEIWNNRSFEVSRQFSWVLRLPLLRFGVMLPLALLGIALSAPHWRRLFPLYAMIAVYLATALMFFVVSRYRMPAVPILIVFAAFGVWHCLDAARTRRFRELAVALATVALFGVAAHVNLVTPKLAVAHYNLGNKYRTLEKWDLAIEQYRTALELDPGYIPTYNNLALVYEETGEHRREAIATWERVLRLGERLHLGAYVERARRHLAELGAGEGGGSPPAPPEAAR
jgi:4-amino-4-deoxy-L-arabinose transferase-like glycosyltransferase